MICWASVETPAKMISKRPTENRHFNIIQIVIRATNKLKKNLRKFPRRIRCSPTRRSVRNMTSSATRHLATVVHSLAGPTFRAVLKIYSVISLESFSVAVLADDVAEKLSKDITEYL